MRRRSSAEDREFSEAIISIGAGQGQLPLILAANRMGWSVIAVDRDRDAVGLRYANVRIEASTHDTDAVMVALDRVGDSHAFSGVVARTTAAEALCTAATISSEFDLPGLTPELIKVATEKSALREFCSTNELPGPESVRVDSEIGRHNFTRFPVIVKPDVTVVGKSCIRLCRSKASIEESLREATQASNNRSAVVEAYVEGIDATCLCWIHMGMAHCIAWWDELVGIDSNNRIVGLGVSVPSVVVGTAAQVEAERIVSIMARHFSDVDALLLISFRFTMEGTPHIIEIHVDLGGDMIADVLLPAADATPDFFELALNIAAGALGEVGRMDCKPTALFYRRGPDMLSVAHAGGRHLVYRGPSVGQNLAALPNIVNEEGIGLSVWPRHLEWLDVNAAKAE